MRSPREQEHFLREGARSELFRLLGNEATKFWGERHGDKPESPAHNPAFYLKRAFDNFAQYLLDPEGMRELARDSSPSNTQRKEALRVLEKEREEALELLKRLVPAGILQEPEDEKRKPLWRGQRRKWFDDLYAEFASEFERVTDTEDFREWKKDPRRSYF